MIVRAVAGLLLAAAVALLARRLRLLAPSGVVAAIATGTIAVAAGWDWGILLIAFFIASSLLSRLGEEMKRERTEGIVAKGGERDAWQVLANGGLFALAAAVWMVAPDERWLAAAAGALAAVTADSWATEIGTLSAAAPRSLFTGEAVPAGTSGGVTAAGLTASLAGALAIALLAAAVGWPRAVAGAAVLGGVAGALADSMLGAVCQERRWCPRCSAATERRAHSCGAPTLRTGGIPGLDNDVVNVLCGAAGALTAMIVAA